MNFPPMFRNGMLPPSPSTYGGRLKVSNVFWSAGLSWSSGVYCPSFIVRRLELGPGERHVVAGVAGAVERHGRGVREHVLAGGRGRAEVRPGAEPGQRDDHRPALGRAERAVLGADVQHLRLAVGGQRRCVDPGRGCLGRPEADRVQSGRRDSSDVLHHRGGRAVGAGRCRRVVRAVAVAVTEPDGLGDDQADDQQQDDADGRAGQQEAASPLGGPGLLGAHRGRP